ncbi:unnamed protein product [Sphagnum jensenii]|jgi:hypothetical protein
MQLNIFTLCEAGWHMKLNISTLCGADWHMKLNISTLCKAGWHMKLSISTPCEVGWHMKLNISVLSPGARFFFSSIPKYDQSLCRVEMPHAFRSTQSQGYELEISLAKPLKLEGTYFTGFKGRKLCSLGSLSIRQSG